MTILNERVTVAPMESRRVNRAGKGSRRQRCAEELDRADAELDGDARGQVGLRPVMRSEPVPARDGHDAVEVGLADGPLRRPTARRWPARGLIVIVNVFVTIAPAASRSVMLPANTALPSSARRRS